MAANDGACAVGRAQGQSQFQATHSMPQHAPFHQATLPRASQQDSTRIVSLPASQAWANLNEYNTVPGLRKASLMMRPEVSSKEPSMAEGSSRVRPRIMSPAMSSWAVESSGEAREA